MINTTTTFAALALVSLGAACTASQPISGTLGSGGAPSAAEETPFVPYTPGDAPAEIMAAPPASGFAGGGGASAQIAGEATGAGGATACSALMAPTVPQTSPFAPNLTGPVTSAPIPPLPVSGGTLLVLADGTTAVASDPDRDRVYVVDLAARAVRATVTLSAGDEPGRLVEDAAGAVHVALRRAGAVVTLDPSTGTIAARTPVCAAPRGLAYEAGRDLIHVACAEGQLVSLHAAGGVFRTVALDGDLRDVVALGAGTLLVSTFRRADALVVDVDGHVSAAARPPARHGVSPLGMPRTLSPAVAWRMVPLAGAGAVMLHQRGVDDEVDPTAGGYAGVKGCDGIVESAATVVAPDGTMAVSPGLAMVTLAVDVAVSPDGQQVALAAAGNAHTPLPQLVVVPLSEVEQSGAACLAASGPPPVVGPPPLAMDGQAAAAPVGEPQGQVVAVAYAANGTLVAQSREPAALWLADGRGAISLSDEPTGDTGHELFHVNAGGGIACASCHPEGGEDGRVWSFACLGPRRTQSVRGGLSGTEPFHWDGDMPDFSALAQAVFVGRMSGPPLTNDQSAALLHWLDGVPELPNPAPADATAVARGGALFASASLGCTACHAGAHLTNNATVDVGTGGKLQVPSLRGVGWRAPYLHDGCAPTLTDRFGACGGGDSHGHTSQLTPSDISDLTVYLRTL